MFVCRSLTGLGCWCIFLRRSHMLGQYLEAYPLLLGRGAKFGRAHVALHQRVDVGAIDIIHDFDHPATHRQPTRPIVRVENDERDLRAFAQDTML